MTLPTREQMEHIFDFALELQQLKQENKYLRSDVKTLTEDRDTFRELLIGLLRVFVGNHSHEELVEYYGKLGLDAIERAKAALEERS